MKTPDEIKKGLECCSKNKPYPCTGCPYERTFDEEWSCKLHSDALAYVQQLEAQIPKWISVEERLPERHGQMCVGLYNQHEAPRTMLFPYLFTWHAYGDNGYVKGPHFSDEGLDGLKVYYWMPLPELPKEEDHD